MAIRFNDLLRSADISPDEVLLVRHQTKPGKNGISLYELWRDDRAGFETYQREQKPKQKAFRTRRLWASFACPQQGTTNFLGLYEARYAETRAILQPCPYRGKPVNDGNPVDLFDVERRPELAAYIDKLEIEWPSASVRSWFQYAENADVPIVGELPAVVAEPLSGDALADALERLGFLQSRATKKLVQMRRGGLIVYVKRDTETRPLVLHPHFLDIADALRTLGGVDVPDPARTYINSNLREFPVYLADHRQSAGRHGFAVGVDANRLGALVELLDQGAKIATPEGEVRLVAPDDDPLTERERLAAARVGQGGFRDALLIYWESVCPVAGVDHAGLLRASHIKAWSGSTNTERLDPFNGLLLCAHVDALFDRHLITFEDDGRIRISPAISQENRERLGLSPDLRISGLDARHAPYLAHHRRHFRA